MCCEIARVEGPPFSIKARTAQRRVLCQPVKEGSGCRGGPVDFRFGAAGLQNLQGGGSLQSGRAAHQPADRVVQPAQAGQPGSGRQRRGGNVITSLQAQVAMLQVGQACQRRGHRNVVRHKNLQQGVEP